jgi:hypothetical protein
MGYLHHLFSTEVGSTGYKEEVGSRGRKLAPRGLPPNIPPAKDVFQNTIMTIIVLGQDREDRN